MYLWERYGDPHIHPFLNDPIVDSLIPHDEENNISYDDDTLDEIEYNAYIKSKDDPLTPPSLTFSNEITHSPLVDDSNESLQKISFSSSLGFLFARYWCIICRVSHFRFGRHI